MMRSKSLNGPNAFAVGLVVGLAVGGLGLPGDATVTRSPPPALSNRMRSAAPVPVTSRVLLFGLPPGLWTRTALAWALMTAGVIWPDSAVTVWPPAAADCWRKSDVGVPWR